MAANDAWASATVLTGLSGSGGDDLYGATLELGEPDLDASAASDATLWYAFTPSVAGTLSFSTASYYNGVGAEIFIGDDLSTLVQQDIDTTGNVMAGLAAGVPVYIRLYPTVALNSAAPFTYSWTFTVSTQDLLVTLVSDCPTCPGSVVVHVGNCRIGDTISFFIDNSGTDALAQAVVGADVGVTVGNVYFVPQEEQLLFVSVPVAETYIKGTHTLTVDSTSGQETIISFRVLDTFADTLLGETETNPTVAASTRWIFKDPAPGGETYVWEINPLTTTSPFAPKVITEAHTTAQDGQPLEWEGSPKAVQWTLSGTLFNQTQLDAFVRFASLERRVWLVDHLNRAWLVTVEELDAEPRTTKGTQQHPWVHDWKMTLFVWKGPVSLA